MALEKLLIETPKIYPAKDPLDFAKGSVIQYLNKQLASAEAAVKGEEYPLVQRKGYFRRKDGKIVFRVRIGNTLADFGEGKTDVVVKDEKTLVAAIKTLIEAVNNGELNEIIEKTLAKKKPRKPRSPSKDKQPVNT